MATVEKTIEVEVPVRTAYNQWTQFEEFPQFMEGVKEVRQMDDKRLQWHAEIAGKEERWEAEITSQVPDQKIAWRSVTGVENAGIVTFHPVQDGKTQVHLRIEYEPQGIVETAGDLLGVVSRRVEGDLERFKKFIESRGSETGAWRGHIHAGEVKDPESARSSFEGDDRGALHRRGEQRMDPTGEAGDSSSGDSGTGGTDAGGRSSGEMRAM